MVWVKITTLVVVMVAIIHMVKVREQWQQCFHRFSIILWKCYGE